MMTHKQKVKLARSRGMQKKIERSRRERIHQPRGGIMISRLFNTFAWLQRKAGIQNRIKKNQAP